jgi:hypothetical protein
MCAINCAQALAPVPFIPRPPGIKQEWNPNLFSDKCDLCVSVLTAIAKLATLNETQVINNTDGWKEKPFYLFPVGSFQVAIMAYVQSICSYLPQSMQTEVLFSFVLESL